MSTDIILQSIYKNIYGLNNINNISNNTLFYANVSFLSNIFVFSY